MMFSYLSKFKEDKAIAILLHCVRLITLQNAIIISMNHILSKWSWLRATKQHSNLTSLSPSLGLAHVKERRDGEKPKLENKRGYQ